mgnify:CR=1 FL=1
MQLVLMTFQKIVIYQPEWLLPLLVHLEYLLQKKRLASGVSKAIPIIGGVISGTINFASMMPMARKLNGTLDKAVFDYSEEEFIEDIELLSNETGEVSEEEKQSLVSVYPTNEQIFFIIGYQKVFVKAFCGIFLSTVLAT